MGLCRKNLKDANGNNVPKCSAGEVLLDCKDKVLGTCEQVPSSVATFEGFHPGSPTGGYAWMGSLKTLSSCSSGQRPTGEEYIPYSTLVTAWSKEWSGTTAEFWKEVCVDSKEKCECKDGYGPVSSFAARRVDLKTNSAVRDTDPNPRDPNPSPSEPGPQLYL